MQRLVRIRLTHRRDGETELVASVYCPSAASSRSLDECLSCADRIGYKADRDDAWVICRRAASDLDDGPAAVAQAMTRSVRCVRADVGVGALEELLLVHAIGGAPVLDEGDRLIGVASLRDVARHRHEGGADTTAANAIATTPPITIGEHEPVARAAARMAFEHIHRLPVVDEAGSVVGIVTALDLVRFAAHEDGFVL